MARSGIGTSARADLPSKNADIIGVDCSSGPQIVQWTEMREGFPISYVKTDSTTNALRIEFPASLTPGVTNAFYEVNDPDGAIEFAVVDGVIRRLDDNQVVGPWSEFLPGTVQKATAAHADVDALLPWNQGTILSDSLGLTPALARSLVEANYVIRTTRTYGVGPSSAADFANLNEAFDFLDGKAIFDKAIAILQLEAGDIVHDEPVRIMHPYGKQIRILGAALTGAAPDHSDFSGIEADGRAMLRSRFSSRLVFSSSSSGGIFIGTACNTIDNVLIESQGSSGSGVVVGYNSIDFAGASAKLNNVSVHGFSSYGIQCANNGGLELRGRGIASYNSVYGFLVSEQALIKGAGARVAQALYSGSYSFYVLDSATLKTQDLISIGGYGIRSYHGSSIISTSTGRLISSSTSIGILSSRNSHITFQGQISDSANRAVYVADASSAYIVGSTISNSGGFAIQALGASSVNFQAGILDPSGNQTIYAADAAFVRADNVTGLPSYSPAQNTVGSHNSYIRV
jgi:hypothetical protein